MMQQDIALIGFGEAGSTFAAAARWGGRATGFDLKADRLAAMRALEVTACPDPAQALRHARLVLCLVTADQALAAARSYGPLLAKGALWCDMNSVSPQTKQAAARAIEAAGASYVDVAVLAPVNPARLAVPLLMAGPQAAAAQESLEGAGFTNCRCVGNDIGRASAIKMIRSIMIKGQEALIGEMMAGAQAAGVVEEVLASLDGSERPQAWRTRCDYALERMATHGLRRAAEMEEAASTLEALGVEPVMTRGTIGLQRARGRKAANPPVPAANSPNAPNAQENRT